MPLALHDISGLDFASPPFTRWILMVCGGIPHLEPAGFRYALWMPKITRRAAACTLHGDGPSAVSQ